MEYADKTPAGTAVGQPAIEHTSTSPIVGALRDTQPDASAALGFSAKIQQSPRLAAQRTRNAALQSSPRMNAQRRQLKSLFGASTQLAPKPGTESPSVQSAPLERQVGANAGPTDGKQPGFPNAATDDVWQPKSAFAEPAGSRSDSLPRPNNTGLPDALKAGIESLSGISLDAVKVHYNSTQPAQLNALAYAQGSEIHVAPGEEKHLPHEAWHVVQQRQGRVRQF